MGDNDDIFVNIKQLGDQKNIPELQKYVAGIDVIKLTSVLEENICQRNGLFLWNYILQSFDDSLDSHEKRFIISLAVLEKLNKSCVAHSQSNEIITRLRLQLPKFKANNLISICDFCVEKIQIGNVLHTDWKDLLPLLLSIIVEQKCVIFNNAELSGLEYKNQLITSLCMINWSANIVTSLASMFRDIPLTKEEHFQVVTKLSQTIDKLTCQELPAFVYQLLRLCSHQNSRCIFLRLQYYFANRIYKHLGKDLEPTSDSTDLDDISDASEHDAIQVESTVLFHIHTVASLGQGSIKDYLNSLKDVVKSPEFILHPFPLTVLLTISTVSIFEEQTLDLIRSCIVRVITEDAKKVESTWFRTIVLSSTKISNVISAVIENSVKERILVVSGLVNLGFALLNVGAGLGQKNIAESQWQLGTFILLKLMKKKRDVSSTVIKQLCNRIVTGQNISHLTECLHQMCRNVTLTMLENQRIVLQLTEQILQLPAETSRHIIDAIIPLVKVSELIRDNLILLLRKALYSGKVEIRQMAVNSYLKLIKNLRISNMNAVSQSNTSSTYSFLTQMSLENHVQTYNKFSNEALCLEVLDILRRCFMQQAEVRTELYDGLYDAVCASSELGIPVLDMLWVHFNQFYDNDDNLPPLLFPKITVTKGAEAILLEPIGHLIYVVALIVTKVKTTHDHSNPSIIRFATILDSLCERMAKCELIHFDLDTGRDLLDNLPECQTDLHILKQSMSVYEALMGYLIDSWDKESENSAKRIYSLFQAYSRLLEFSKNLSKPKKAEGKKKSKNDSKNKTTVGKSKLLFKPAATVIDFQTADKILKLLHEQTVSWATIPETNILKVKREFHRYILSVVLQLVQNIKTSKCIETSHTKPYFNYCSTIASTLYDRIVNRLNYVIDFDCTTAVLGVECFNLILSLVCTHYKEKLVTFLTNIGSKNKDEDLAEHLMPFIERFHNFFEKDDDDYAGDPEGKKLPVLLVNCYTIFVSNLPNHGHHPIKVLDWLKAFINNNTVSNKNVGHSLISVTVSLSIRCKADSNLYQNIAIALSAVIGTINQEKPELPVPLKIINEGTALPTVNTLANALKVMLNEADWLIQRCLAEYNLINYPGGEKIDRRKELLKGKERDLCCHLCRIISVCTYLSNLAVPAGLNAETVFKILMHLYNTLNSLTKYFLRISSKINPAFQSARFEHVLKISGKQLSNKVYEFILYIEEGPQSDDEAAQKKKSANPNAMKTKILRETRLIPKLVYEMEQFGRNVIALSNKTKIDLSKYVGLGTSRDFRIKAPELKQALENDARNLDETVVSDANEEESLSGQNEEENVEEEENMEVDEEEENQNEDVPPKKKSKK